MRKHAAEPHEQHQEKRDAGERAGYDESVPFMLDLRLLLFERAHFFRVPHRVADSNERILQLFESYFGAVILDQSLFMSEADMNFIDPFHAPEGPLDRLDAKRTGHAADFKLHLFHDFLPDRVHSFSGRPKAKTECNLDRFYRLTSF